MRMTHRLSLFSGSSGLVSLGGVSGGGGLVNSGSDLSKAKFNVETPTRLSTTHLFLRLLLGCLLMR